MAERFGVSAIPVMIVFRDSQEVAKVVGKQTKADVVKALTEAGV